MLGDEAHSLIEDRLHAGFEVPPFTDPATVYGSGVGFYRAFALQLLHGATGRPERRENVARRILHPATRTDLGRSGDYRRRHSIAQIEVRVLDASHGD